MGQVAGGRRGVWTRRRVWVGINSVDLQEGAFPPVSLEGGVPTAVQEEVEGLGQLGRTHKACLLDISGHCLTQMIRQTCWTSPPPSQTPAKLHPPPVMSHLVQLLVLAGPLHSPSGAPRLQVLGWRVQPRHIAPQPGLHTAMAAWRKHPPPLLPIPNPLLHLSHTLLAPPILPRTATTPLATPPLLPQCHRGPPTAALHTDLDTTVARPQVLVRLGILATRQQPSEAIVDILRRVIPPWCGGNRQDPYHQEEGTCLWPKVAPSAPAPLQKVSNSTTPISGATGKSLVATCHHKKYSKKLYNEFKKFLCVFCVFFTQNSE